MFYSGQISISYLHHKHHTHSNLSSLRFSLCHKYQVWESSLTSYLNFKYCLHLPLLLINILLTGFGIMVCINFITVSQLDELRGLVKGSLTRVQRQVLSALIVIEVHARDVLLNLVQLQVENINEFDWISQLR